ncbi:MAG: hypothetical protein M3003_00885 [Candidatus Dormibacteraeota bacterium]|nr:hypothetical protein [Candidatus Dormibacteraeota bacterium]
MKLYPVVVRKTTTVAGGGPTFTIADAAGAAEAITQPWRLPEAAGAADTAVAMVANPTEYIGATDSLNVAGVPKYSDCAGPGDAVVLVAAEAAQGRSPTPDADSWGDAWVDRLLANQGVNHGAAAALTVSAGSALSQTDGYAKIDFRRFASLVGGAGASTLTFAALWSAFTATPAGTLLVDLVSNAASPWTESTITANNRARFTSSSPYSRRSFGAVFDGVTRTHTITFTPAEVNDFVGNWLELQFTVADLTAASIGVQSREAAVATDRPSYSLSLAKG